MIANGEVWRIFVDPSILIDFIIYKGFKNMEFLDCDLFVSEADLAILNKYLYKFYLTLHIV